MITAPSLNNMARNSVLGERYLPGSNIGKAWIARLLNEEVELISRVVTHPAFRGCGLGVRLVRETMPLRRRRYIESSSAMGQVNPFFEHAGMRAYELAPSPATQRVLAALRAVGIEETVVPNPAELSRRIAALPADLHALVAEEIIRYERFWRGRTILKEETLNLEGGIRRVAGNALMRPLYFLWSDPAWEAARPSRTPG